MNPNKTSIIALTASDGTVYGLGNDGKVYVWRPSNAQWELLQDRAK